MGNKYAEANIIIIAFKYIIINFEDYKAGRHNHWQVGKNWAFKWMWLADPKDDKGPFFKNWMANKKIY